jgi:succinate-acetate transporter protein
MPTGRPFWFPDIKAFIAIMVIFAVIAIAFTLIFSPNVMDNDMLKMVVGALVTNFAGIAHFYFGSSTGSKDKDDTIGRIAAGQMAPVPTPDKPVGGA